MKNKAFKAQNNEYHNGFQMTFENGCTISVQFNKFNYCDEGETTAEVAAWNSNNEWMIYDGNKWVVLIGGETDVMSHQTPDDIAKLIYTLSNVIWKYINIEKQH
jgi:hypothetical protein